MSKSFQLLCLLYEAYRPPS